MAGPMRPPGLSQGSSAICDSFSQAQHKFASSSDQAARRTIAVDQRFALHALDHVDGAVAPARPAAPRIRPARVQSRACRAPAARGVRRGAGVEIGRGRGAGRRAARSAATIALMPPWRQSRKSASAPAAHRVRGGMVEHGGEFGQPRLVVIGAEDELDDRGHRRARLHLHARRRRAARHRRRGSARRPARNHARGRARGTARRGCACRRRGPRRRFRARWPADPASVPAGAGVRRSSG